MLAVEAGSRIEVVWLVESRFFGGRPWEIRCRKLVLCKKNYEVNN